MKRPNKDEYALYYHTYIEKVPDGDVVKSMNKQYAHNSFKCLEKGEEVYE